MSDFFRIFAIIYIIILTMKKFLFISIFCGIVFCSNAQIQHQQTMFLAKTYGNFMFRNQPTKEVLKELKGIKESGMEAAVDFITQTITSKNKILTTKYLKRPDDNTLKQIYIIRAVSQNLDKNSIEKSKLIDSLGKADIPVYELVDNYYEMVFLAVGNKNQPFNLSKVNFKMDDYQLKDETERGIFFLKCMRFCGTTIWGYINIAKPMNTSTALEYINKFPKFNGQPYYQYNDFSFDDFEMVILKDNGKESYKGYYLNKYYETLLSHLLCLNKEGRSEKEINDLLLGSILKERSLYSYTKYKETLEGIFKEVPRP